VKVYSTYPNKEPSMYLVCACGKTEETANVPESLKSPQNVSSSEDWRISPYEITTNRQETGENPLIIHGVVRAFCCAGCEKEARDEHFRNLLKR
jgi:hypothetical protein